MHGRKAVVRFFRAFSAAVEADRLRLFRATSAARSKRTDKGRRHKCGPAVTAMGSHLGNRLEAFLEKIKMI